MARRRCSRPGRVCRRTASCPAHPSGPSARPSRTSAPPTACCRRPLLWPVDVLPVAGRQLRSVQDLSGAARAGGRTSGIGGRGPVPDAAPPAAHGRAPTVSPPCTSSPRWRRPPTAPWLASIWALTRPLSVRSPTSTTTFLERPDAGPYDPGPHVGGRLVGRHHPAGTGDLPPPGRQQRRDAVGFRGVRGGRDRHHRQR